MSGYAEPCFGAGASGCKSKEKSNYEAGGARGADCENTGTVAGTISSGKEREATGFSNSADGANSNCTGV